MGRANASAQRLAIPFAIPNKATLPRLCGLATGALIVPHGCESRNAPVHQHRCIPAHMFA